MAYNVKSAHSLLLPYPAISSCVTTLDDKRPDGLHTIGPPFFLTSVGWHLMPWLGLDELFHGVVHYGLCSSEHTLAVVARSLAGRLEFLVIAE